MKRKVSKLGGNTYKNPDSYLPLEIENKFMENVINFEKAPVRPLHKTLKIKLTDFPEEETLSSEQIDRNLKILREILNKHNIYIDFSQKVPARLTYKHILEYLNDSFTAAPGMALHLDGCTGNCEDCWQLESCESGKGNDEGVGEERGNIYG